MPGPLNTFENVYLPPGNKVVERAKYRSRGTKPYVPREYYMTVHKVNLSSYDDRYDYPLGLPNIGNIGTLRMSDFTSDYGELYNLAYASFKNKLGQTAGFGINAIQSRQNMDMITKRVTQLASFANHVRKYRFGAAASALGLTALPRPKKVGDFDTRGKTRRIESWQVRNDRVRKNIKVRRSAKSFADNFLEFQFGWAPLVNDIYTAVNILQRPFPMERIKGARQKSFKQTDSVAGPYGFTTYDYALRTQLCAFVQVSNPNLRLADLLGLVNPAVILLDAVPFSFVAGWFVNLEQVLSSFTDFAGLSITRGCVTSSLTGATTSIHPYSPTNPWTSWRQGSMFEIRRTVGLGSGPTLRIKPPWTCSPVRGLIATSLLVQKLKG